MAEPRIGIVGCGTISDLLLEGARTGNVGISAVCDVDEQKARRAAFPFDAQVFNDYERMLSEAKLDGVIVALPNFMHFAAAAQALESGKHVFCEKTMTTNPTDSRKLAAKALQAGKGKKPLIFQMGYMKRFNPAFNAVKKHLNNIGPVTNATFRLTINASPVLKGKKATPASWHGDIKKVGGGFLVHSGSHLIDLMMFYFGLPESAWGTLSRDVNGNEYVNNFLLKMQSGLFLNLQLFMTRAQGFSYAGSVWEEKVEINGLGGRLYAEDADWMGKVPSRAFIHRADGNGPQALFTLWESQWAEELKAFAQGIRKGKCLGSNAVDGYRVDYILHQLKKLEKQEKVNFDFAL
jgi:predicted dehydrogenase